MLGRVSLIVHSFGDHRLGVTGKMAAESRSNSNAVKKPMEIDVQFCSKRLQAKLILVEEYMCLKMIASPGYIQSVNSSGG